MGGQSDVLKGWRMGEWEVIGVIFARKDGRLSYRTRESKDEMLEQGQMKMFLKTSQYVKRLDHYRKTLITWERSRVHLSIYP